MKSVFVEFVPPVPWLMKILFHIHWHHAVYPFTTRGRHIIINDVLLLVADADSSCRCKEVKKIKSQYCCSREAVHCEINWILMASIFRRMCGHSPRGFSPSWATNQAVDPSAQQKLDQRQWWENPGKNTATGTRRRKYGALTSIWMPEDDLES